MKLSTSQKNLVHQLKQGNFITQDSKGRFYLNDRFSVHPTTVKTLIENEIIKQITVKANSLCKPERWVINDGYIGIVA